jgi:thiamine biosynthesis lipoprotein
MVKKIIYKKWLLILISIATISFIGCSPRVHKKTFVVSGTYLTITSADSRAARIAYRRWSELDNIFNNHKKGSEISKVNRNPQKKNKVSQELIELLKLSKEVHQLTQGYFDISQGQLYHFWKTKLNRKNIRWPSREKIKQLKNQGGVRFIDINEQENTVMIAKKGLKIDLSGIAKGYMVDQVSISLKKAGISSALIDAGGDIYCLGSNQNKPWKIGVREPTLRHGIIEAISLNDEAIATSGGYEQFFTYKGQRYSHLINPVTGYPVENNIASVTVITKNCTTADSLATALYVMGFKRMNDFFSRVPSTMKVYTVVNENDQTKLYIF